jgi:hypothetical protein
MLVLQDVAYCSTLLSDSELNSSQWWRSDPFCGDLWSRVSGNVFDWKAALRGPGRPTWTRPPYVDPAALGRMFLVRLSSQVPSCERQSLKLQTLSKHPGGGARIHVNLSIANPAVSTRLCLQTSGNTGTGACAPELCSA